MGRNVRNFTALHKGGIMAKKLNKADRALWEHCSVQIQSIQRRLDNAIKFGLDTTKYENQIASVKRYFDDATGLHYDDYQ